MEIFGGFVVMMSIIGLFLAVVWMIMPFVVFAIKGKQDRTLEVLEAIERRLASLEALLAITGPGRDKGDSAGDSAPSEASSAAAEVNHPIEHTETLTGPAVEKEGPEASHAV